VIPVGRVADFEGGARRIVEAVAGVEIAWSDYPHWDFDVPARIYDLPFLAEEQKRAILGANAMPLFGLR
jgi:hypothetical protein